MLLFKLHAVNDAPRMERKLLRERKLLVAMFFLGDFKSAKGVNSREGEVNGGKWEEPKTIRGAQG